MRGLRKATRKKRRKRPGKATLKIGRPSWRQWPGVKSRRQDLSGRARAASHGEDKNEGAASIGPPATALIRAKLVVSVDQLFGVAGAAGAVFILCIW